MYCTWIEFLTDTPEEGKRILSLLADLIVKENAEVNDDGQEDH